jgi:hypothetical protein
MINRLTLFKEIIAVYCENRMKHTNRGKSEELPTVKVTGTYTWLPLGFKGLIKFPAAVSSKTFAISERF